MSRRAILKGAIIPVWEKFTADSITLTVGTSANTLSDLQERHDGNVFDITENNSAPAMDLIVDFINVPIFDYVRIFQYYVGGAAHFLNDQLFNWETGVWDSWKGIGTLACIQQKSFFVQEPTCYIGQGGDSGRVRVKILHPSMGITAHHAFIDEISLFRFT